MSRYSSLEMCVMLQQIKDHIVHQVKCNHTIRIPGWKLTFTLALHVQRDVQENLLSFLIYL